jgi:hypothetical protein
MTLCMLLDLDTEGTQVPAYAAKNMLGRDAGLNQAYNRRRIL